MLTGPGWTANPINPTRPKHKNPNWVVWSDLFGIKLLTRPFIGSDNGYEFYTRYLTWWFEPPLLSLSLSLFNILTKPNTHCNTYHTTLTFQFYRPLVSPFFSPADITPPHHYHCRHTTTLLLLVLTFSVSFFVYGLPSLLPTSSFNRCNHREDHRCQCYHYVFARKHATMTC